MRTLCVALLFVLLTACATTPQVKMGEYYPKKISNLAEIVAEVQQRNHTLEQHPAWITMASQGFLIKNLSRIPDTDYPKYAKYLDDGDIYVIVHPAYSVFFNDEEDLYYNDARNPANSFMDEASYTKTSRLIREQERAMRDFLEITSTRKRLIVLILPGRYQYYRGYLYRGETDMFARYINSVTNSSESVVYLYSQDPNRGRLSAESRDLLSKFLRAVDPKKVVIGGGYLGRCIEDFYKEFSPVFGKKMMIAGEISAFSHDDLGHINVDDFLSKDGKLNIEALRKVVSSMGMKGGTFKDILRNYRNYRNNRRQGE